jgi:uncharacterized protein DUF3300
MKLTRPGSSFRYLSVMGCAVALLHFGTLPGAEPKPATAAQTKPQTPQAKVPPEQLDALVAPIALYPDPLLAQTLAASTYPLEVVQLQQWLEKNPSLKDQPLADAVKKQDWDPSIQAMAALPDVVKRLADDIQWTTDLGNAFLAQQSDVMDAVQRMRQKAKDTGNLKSSPQQKVETKVVEEKTVIVVEQADPQVVYVPSYNPVVVYGPPVYPYPPIYYPPPGYYYGGMAISFGLGVAMGAMWSGGWGWGCGWGGSSHVNINVNNNFNRVSHFNSARGSGNWQHNPQHRGGTPYSDRATANRFGGTTRGDSLANRQAGARQQIGSQGGNLGSARSGGAGGGLGDRASGGGAGGGGFGGDRASGSASGGGYSNRSSSSVGGAERSAGGADSIGGRDFSRSGGGGDRGAFGGSSRGYNGSYSRASSSRGASSMGSRGMRGGGRRR